MIEDGLVYILDDKHLLNRKELIETFQDFIIKGKKRDIPFTDKWLRNPNKSKKRWTFFHKELRLMYIIFGEDIKSTSSSVLLKRAM